MPGSTLEFGIDKPVERQPRVHTRARGAAVRAVRRVPGSFASTYVHFFRRSPLAGISVACLILFSLVAIFAAQLAPQDPYLTDVKSVGQPPSAEHWFGTDLIGRDVLSRVIYGSRITLMVVFAAILLGDSVGFIWGVASGYIGGKFDLISQRALDILISFPAIILALLLLAAIGGGVLTVIIAIAIINIPGSTRIIRSTVLSVKTMPYVEAARTMGASPPRIMARHVAPQCLAPALVIYSVGLGGAVFAESALSFLGVGVPPPAPSWGNILGSALNNLFSPLWWLVLFPGAAITLTIMSFNLLGDGLRDFVDPKLRNRLR